MIDLGYEEIKKPTYISSNIHPALKIHMTKLLKEFKDNFIWDYDEIRGLSRDLVELKLPFQLDKRPVKHMSSRWLRSSIINHQLITTLI